MRSARYLLLLLPLLTQAQAGDNIAPAAPASTSAAVRALEAELAEAGAAGPPPAFVYLVTRLKLTGTDLTQVVFFSHSAIRTLDDCETERNAGLTSGWQYFSRYYLKTLKGISYEVDYRCVGSERQLAPWRQGAPQDHYYLVQTRDRRLSLRPFPNFFACRDALRQVSRTEDVDAFCATSAQAVLEPKPEEPF